MVSLQAFLKHIHNVPTHIIYAKNPSLLFHTVGTHSPRQSRTKNRRSKTRRSKHYRTSIGGQTDWIKWSSLHFYWQGGVDRSQVNESWSQSLSVVRSYARYLLLTIVENKIFLHSHKQDQLISSIHLPTSILEGSTNITCRHFSLELGYFGAWVVAVWYYG